MSYLRGLRGADLAIAIALTPLLIPFWGIGYILKAGDSIRSWWWNS